ncbi:MAG TPA: hypothetical protein VG738_14360 [Chitinophagaceae bacterium]|nr:hypothetical protein [Chitinophagaceae bacterium]
MKNYYIAQVQVFIDGKDGVIIPIGGQGYDPNFVKRAAEERVREYNKGKMITSVILSKQYLDIEEYRAATGNNPTWFGPFGGN